MALAYNRADTRFHKLGKHEAQGSQSGLQDGLRALKPFSAAQVIAIDWRALQTYAGIKNTLTLLFSHLGSIELIVIAVPQLTKKASERNKAGGPCHGTRRQTHSASGQPLYIYRTGNGGRKRPTTRPPMRRVSQGIDAQ
ncbi:Uu.00g085300.m01.CDS01 [Anthostomella pinea]|uniref:Uu.00g085300.m01.CDS01 n=1 Tax=Anthostomella pinea TaxID=933095 RepID=A0AAI8VLX6_9PEZI|nr:Uu.00g085300.m01.CDS01 [Anthostomella pinea]